MQCASVTEVRACKWQRRAATAQLASARRGEAAMDVTCLCTVLLPSSSPLDMRNDDGDGDGHGVQEERVDCLLISDVVVGRQGGLVKHVIRAVPLRDQENVASGDEDSWCFPTAVGEPTCIEFSSGLEDGGMIVTLERDAAGEQLSLVCYRNWICRRAADACEPVSLGSQTALLSVNVAGTLAAIVTEDNALDIWDLQATSTSTAIATGTPTGTSTATSAAGSRSLSSSATDATRSHSFSHSLWVPEHVLHVDLAWISDSVEYVSFGDRGVLLATDIAAAFLIFAAPVARRSPSLVSVSSGERDPHAGHVREDPPEVRSPLPVIRDEQTSSYHVATPVRSDDTGDQDFDTYLRAGVSKSCISQLERLPCQLNPHSHLAQTRGLEEHTFSALLLWEERLVAGGTHCARAVQHERRDQRQADGSVRSWFHTTVALVTTLGVVRVFRLCVPATAAFENSGMHGEGDTTTRTSRSTNSSTRNSSSTNSNSSAGADANTNIHCSQSRAFCVADFALADWQVCPLAQWSVSDPVLAIGLPDVQSRGHAHHLIHIVHAQRLDAWSLPVWEPQLGRAPSATLVTAATKHTPKTMWALHPSHMDFHSKADSDGTTNLRADTVLDSMQQAGLALSPQNCQSATTRTGSRWGAWPTEPRPPLLRPTLVDRQNLSLGGGRGFTHCAICVHERYIALTIGGAPVSQQQQQHTQTAVPAVQCLRWRAWGGRTQDVLVGLATTHVDCLRTLQPFPAEQPQREDVPLSALVALLLRCWLFAAEKTAALSTPADPAKDEGAQHVVCLLLAAQLALYKHRLAFCAPQPGLPDGILGLVPPPFDERYSTKDSFRAERSGESASLSPGAIVQFWTAWVDYMYKDVIRTTHILRLTGGDVVSVRRMGLPLSPATSSFCFPRDGLCSGGSLPWEVLWHLTALCSRMCACLLHLGDHLPEDAEAGAADADAVAAHDIDDADDPRNWLSQWQEMASQTVAAARALAQLLLNSPAALHASFSSALEGGGAIPDTQAGDVAAQNVLARVAGIVVVGAAGVRGLQLLLGPLHVPWAEFPDECRADVERLCRSLAQSDNCEPGEEKQQQQQQEPQPQQQQSQTGGTWVALSPTSPLRHYARLRNLLEQKDVYAVHR